MAKTTHKRHFGCTVESHRGVLRFRFRWRSRRYTRSTQLPDTAENRAQVEKLARLVAATIAADKDPLPLLEPKALPATRGGGLTVRGFFERWILDKRPPLVRRAQARDYRAHIEHYVLPRLGDVPLADLRPSDLLGVRGELLSRGLSVKYVKNIVSASFRAMIRDACDDELIAKDPYLALRRRKWPEDVSNDGPDPFTTEERDRILGWFAKKVYGDHCRYRKHPSYLGYLTFLFWTGARPSEASGLQWGDVDLKGKVVFVRRSFHLVVYAATKTKRSVRRVQLTDEVVALLRELQPLRVEPTTPLFTNLDGTPIEPKTFSAHWYACLRALGIRTRGLYQTKHTFVSLALTAGVNVHWLEGQVGVSYLVLRKHYGRYMTSEGPDQLAKMVANATAHPPQAPTSDFGTA